MSEPDRHGLSLTRLRDLQPDLFSWRGLLVRQPWNGRRLGGRQVTHMLAEHLAAGDSRAALVVRVSPLIVAPYTDELDCVGLLSLPDWGGDHQLRPGGRLLTVNTDGRSPRVGPDPGDGDRTAHGSVNILPLIAGFLSDDAGAIAERKRHISRANWDRATQLAVARMPQPAVPIRDGRPLFNRLPAPVGGPTA